MSWITLACVIAVALIVPGNAQSDPIMKVEGDMDIAYCSYFKGIETSKCCHHNFEVTDKDLKGFTSSNAYYSPWKSAAKHVEDCNDGDTWWRKCPCEYSDTIFAGTSKDLMGICSADPAVSTICRKSCNQCGKDNYLTAPRVLASTKQEECCEFAESYPFNCINKVVTEVYKPSILTMTIETTNLCLTGEVSANSLVSCLSFLYRRRASSTIKAKKLTEMIVCHTNDLTEDEATKDGVNPFCTVRDSNGILEQTLGVNDGHAAQKSEIKKEHCDFNTWILGQKTLTVDCSAKATYNTIAFIIQRGVDHFDLDEIKVNHGACVQPTGATATAGATPDLQFETVYQW